MRDHESIKRRERIAARSLARYERKWGFSFQSDDDKSSESSGSVRESSKIRDRMTARSLAEYERRREFSCHSDDGERGGVRSTSDHDDAHSSDDDDASFDGIKRAGKRDSDGETRAPCGRELPIGNVFRTIYYVCVISAFHLSLMLICLRAA